MSTIRNKDKWDSLSMKEKSDMMKVAVQQGIYSLSDIRKAYNEYAEGGPVIEGGELPEVTVIPNNIYLHTYRPIIDSAYKKTGHSTLISQPLWKGGRNGEYLGPGINISNDGNNSNYNLLLNNCSDATRRALEAISGDSLNPVFFTTPGDVKDYAEDKMGGVTHYQNGHYVTTIPISLKEREFLSSFKGDDPANEGVIMKSKGGVLNKFAEGGPENQPYTPFLNETPMQAAMRQIQSPEARAAYWNATHPQTTNETPIVAQPDGTFRRETRNIPLNTAGEAAKTALEFTPVVGDVMFAGDVADEARQGNYGTAAALAGLAVLPNVVEKPLKKGLRKIGLFDNATTAARATPAEWTAAQDAAIATGDMAEAQRLRDLHFATNAPNTVIKNVDGTPAHVYHGTFNKGWNSYDKRKFGTSTDNGMYGEGLYATSDRSYADVYARGNDADGKYIGEIKDLYVNGEHPFYVFNKKDLSPKEIVNREDAAYQFGRTLKVQDDIPKPIWDEMNNSDIVIETKGAKRPNFAEIVVPRGEQIKLADAVTYDNNGVRIPLGERDNFNVNDIRYIWPTALLGGTAAASYANQQGLGGPLVQLANRYEEGGDTNEYNNIIDWIINEEGFNSKPENIGDGKITLGSGLTNPKWLKMYEEKGVWTPEDNRTAVTEEVENRRKWSEENVPNWIELPTDSQNALLSYKYNYDFTPKNSPLMFQALRDKNWEEAARQINATSSNPRFRKGLQARRQREQEMFMRGIDSMNAPEPEVVEEVPQEESIYTPPQRVLDNMAAHNGRYMIMGNPPFAGVRNTVLDALRRLKALNLFIEGGPLVDLANRTK